MCACGCAWMGRGRGADGCTKRGAVQLDDGEAELLLGETVVGEGAPPAETGADASASDVDHLGMELRSAMAVSREVR